MKAIKNIIFDFGGVIYDIDYEKAINAFKKLGYNDFEHMYSQAIQNHLFEKLECGSISENEFKKELLNDRPDINESHIEAAWNAILIGFKAERIQLLEEIKQHYNIYILSNSNIIHYRVFLKEFQQMTSYLKFDDLFDKVFYSFDIGCRKPDAEAYEYVLKNAGIVAEESLFIDDSIQNLAPAQKLGIQTLFLDLSKKEDMLDLFENAKLKDEVLNRIN